MLSYRALMSVSISFPGASLTMVPFQPFGILLMRTLCLYNVYQTPTVDSDAV
jgi:hypothetical protein